MMFVDAEHGDDKNPGTPEQPKRTIRAALDVYGIDMFIVADTKAAMDAWEGLLDEFRRYPLKFEDGP